MQAIIILESKMAWQKSSNWTNTFQLSDQEEKISAYCKDTSEAYLKSYPETGKRKIPAALATIVAGVFAWALTNNPSAIITPPIKFMKNNPP
jgi:hypothetical protein